MKRIIIRCSLIIALIGIVAASDARAQAPTEQTRQVTVIQDMAPVGLAAGQSLRITVSDPNLPDQSGHPTGYKALVCIFIADGKQIARSEEIAIPAGGFHSFDFDRNDLPLAGEPGTGRLQTRAQVRYRPFHLLDRTRAIGSSVSLELIDNSTGNTHAVWVTVGFFEVVPHQ